MANNTLTIEDLITQSDVFINDASLAKAAKGIFEFTHFLLDNDENLTRTSNLNSKAREALQQRTLELLGISEEPMISEQKEVSHD